jgi:hypothetical protein
VIPPPNGETVSASCRKCGTKKTWRTSLEELQVKRGWHKAAEARLAAKEKLT